MSRLSNEYEEGIKDFFRVAEAHAKGSNSIPCPCSKCGNGCKLSLKVVKNHLYANGFDKTYRTWIWHGEVAKSAAPLNDDPCDPNL